MPSVSGAFHGQTAPAFKNREQFISTPTHVKNIWVQLAYQCTKLSRDHLGDSCVCEL